MNRSKKPWLLALALFLLSTTLGLWLNDWFKKNHLTTRIISPPESIQKLEKEHPILFEKEKIEEASKAPTKATPKSFMQRQGKVVNNSDLRFTKEDYLGEMAKKSVDEEPDFFETEYDIDHIKERQALSDAQKKVQDNMGKIIQAQDKMNGQLNLDLKQYKLNDTQTERFAIKLQFPDQTEDMKLKIHYREAPNFGSSANIPEPILPEVKKEAQFIEVEKSKTSESPWNTFNRNY